MYLRVRNGIAVVVLALATMAAHCEDPRSSRPFSNVADRSVTLAIITGRDDVDVRIRRLRTDLTLNCNALIHYPQGFAEAAFGEWETLRVLEGAQPRTLESYAQQGATRRCTAALIDVDGRTLLAAAPYETRVEIRLAEPITGQPLRVLLPPGIDAPDRMPILSDAQLAGRIVVSNVTGPDGLGCRELQVRSFPGQRLSGAWTLCLGPLAFPIVAGDVLVVSGAVDREGVSVVRAGHSDSSPAPPWSAWLFAGPVERARPTGFSSPVTVRLGGATARVHIAPAPCATSWVEESLVVSSTGADPATIASTEQGAIVRGNHTIRTFVASATLPLVTDPKCPPLGSGAVVSLAVVEEGATPGEADAGLPMAAEITPEPTRRAP